VIQSKNVILHEYSITQLLVILRRLNNISHESNASETLIRLQQEVLNSYAQPLTEVLHNTSLEAEVYEEVNKYFLLIEEIFNSLAILGKVNPMAVDTQITTFTKKLLEVFG
jgi:hypothetical protein